MMNNGVYLNNILIEQMHVTMFELDSIASLLICTLLEG